MPRPSPVTRRGIASASAELARHDPILARVIASVGVEPVVRTNRRQEDHYGTLVRVIIGQQISAKAAASVFARLVERFDGRTPTPQQILADDPEQLRTVGLSRAKTAYLISLAQHIVDGELELDHLDALPDEIVIEELTAVKGLGVWSAQMFLMFHLRRPDVLPTGDLGIRNAVQRAYDLTAPPPPAQLTEIATPWRPHRTLACRFLWRSLDNEPSA